MTAINVVLAQKQNGRVNPLKNTRWIINGAERNYYECEREALRKLRTYVLPALPVDLIADNQRFNYAFRKKDVHGRLSHCQHLIAEFDLHVVYGPGMENASAHFLSRETGNEASLPTSEDDGMLSLFVFYSSTDLEAFFIKDKCDLCGNAVQKEDSRLRCKIRRTSNSFLIWNG